MRALLVLAILATAGGATVRSSLDGSKVLPHRIRWTAYPSVASSKVREVDFRVDGRLVWRERHPPYTYGMDGNWLVTSWLEPGEHRFTATVVTTGGGSASDTVHARTLAPAPPPPALAGTWRRTITQVEAGTQTPAGTWTLRVDAGGWHLIDPQRGENWVDVAYLSSDRLEARGGIWTTPVEGRGGNGWCEDTNAAVDYTWARSGATLTLTLAGPDRCGDPRNKQHFIWAGKWTRGRP